MRVTYVFDEVAVRGTRTWVDSVTGKRRQRTKKFSQTINPYNRNANNVMKTRFEIQVEIAAERRAWLDLPLEEWLKVEQLEPLLGNTYTNPCAFGHE